jgi:pantoate--beta-alanine ligase
MNDSATRPIIVTDRRSLRATLEPVRHSGRTIALVPTMGALHEGHLSLVDAARRSCAFVVVTIFVNPTQFGPGEDFTRYPRTFENDVKLVATRGADLVFAPDIAEMYPPGHQTSVHVQGITEVLEGPLRPGHFDGVATIVLKLFELVGAQRAFFGQKDYQQCLLVQQMVRDLDVPIEIEVCPIVREPDGLAMSSRNVYLSPSERQRALALSQSLQLAKSLVSSGQTSAEVILARMRDHLTAADAKIDYVALADPRTLAPVQVVRGRTVALVAARVGATRLIDNLVLDESNVAEQKVS